LYCAALLPIGIDGLDTPVLPSAFWGAPRALVAPVLEPDKTGLDLNGAVFAEEGFDVTGAFAVVEGLNAGADFEVGTDLGAEVDLVAGEGFEIGALDGAGAFAGAGRAFFA